MTGVVNTLVHIGVFTFLLYMQFPVVLANVFAFMCANIFSFFASSYFVFKVNTSSIYYYWRFLSLSIIGVSVSFVISIVCEKLQLHSYISVLGVVLIMPPVSYLLQKVAFLGGKVSVR
ncbi:GtrA family protein [Desulfomicrobium norvegicum]|uniref:GtrA family protein n=1 Tax=Desulfomicrobium norvegicum (strain DSM 1741 / NCIMB 8310) TaxID=52561 RepID=UPI00137B5592